MPIYEFKCNRCDQRFEKLCRMGESDGVACPNCGAEASRLFSTFYSRGGSSDGSSSSRSCSGCTSSSCAGCR